MIQSPGDATEECKYLLIYSDLSDILGQLLALNSVSQNDVFIVRDINRLGTSILAISDVLEELDRKACTIVAIR